MGTPRRPAAPRRGVTWEEFLDLDEDDPRELVDGELVEIDVPGLPHEWVVTQLTSALNAWALANHAGIVVPSGFKVKIRHDRGVMPDVQLFRTGGRPIPEKGLDAGAPDLAVEVVSPTSRGFDRMRKLAWYASIGTPEYCLVDPERRTLDRFVLAPSGRLELAESLAGDVVFRPTTLEGFALDLATLWSLPDWFR